MTHLLRFLGATLALALVAAPALGLLLAPACAPRSGAETGAPDAAGSHGLRVSGLHWALTLADPLMIDCLWNSVAMTALVVALAAPTGIVLARLSRASAGWRRRACLLLIRLAGACHPFFAAIGLGLLLAQVAPASEAPAGWPGVSGRARWLVLGLAQFGFASGWIAWWTGRALDRVGPEWLRSAAWSGARPGWIWRKSVWPLVRPTVARASASVFAVLLIEPGGPIVLGLRHTVGHQVVGALWMSSRDDLARGAILATLAWLVAAFVRLLLIRGAGHDHLASARPPRPGPAGPIAPAGRLRAAAGLLVLLAWLPIALGPALALVVQALRSFRVGPQPWADLAPVVGSALALGGVSALMALGLAWPLSASRWTRSLPATLLETAPPLALGVGLVGLWHLARAQGGIPAGGPMTPDLARWIDPYRSPWLLVGWATALAHLPWAIEAARRSRAVNARALQDEARVAGDRRAFSRTLLLLPIGLRRCLAPAIGVALLAGSGLAPAIVLTPLEPFRPLGAWALRTPIDDPIAPAIAALGLLAQVLGVLLLARGDRPESLVTVPRV